MHKLRLDVINKTLETLWNQMSQKGARKKTQRLALGALVIITVSLSIALAARDACSHLDYYVAKNKSTTAFSEVDSTGRIPAYLQGHGDKLEPWKQIRLPQIVKPLHYDLVLLPDLFNGSFSGNVTITVYVVEATNVFLVHAHKLEIKHVHVNEHGNEPSTPSRTKVPITNTFLFPENEFLVIELENPVAVGTYNIFIQFHGSLLNQIVGFYRSKYVDIRTNQTRYLAVSQFEPTYARSAFPCFDEPTFKSTFTIHLIHPKEFIALSNMNIKTSVAFDIAEGLQKTSFERSAPMVTYLVCVIVCNFNYTESFTAEGKPFRVYARSDQMGFTKLASEIGNKIQDAYESYFELPYPLPKQDMIAIPDFHSGAMENWGLITFRETTLLYDPFHSSEEDMEGIVETIAHELTHQWFGNLVTIKWWDDLWLNEGFASFFSHKGLSLAKPEWETEASIIFFDMIKSFDLDVRANSHPIVQPVCHPNEIASIFDEISYSKGASVIRMLEGFMDKKKFQKGIQRFLQAHKYSHATTKDLWNAMSKENQGLNVAQIMDTWTRQKGFPVVHIKRKGTVFRASQNRFLFHHNYSLLAKNESLFGYSWEVPLSYRTEKQNEPTLIWIHQNTKSVTFSIENISDTDWVKFNADTTGYYRVNYELSGWICLIQLLTDNHQMLNACDRTGLVDDAFALAEANHIPYDVPLTLIKYLTNERVYEPWLAARRQILRLNKLLQTTADYGYFRNYVIKIISPVYNQLSWNDMGTHADKKLRKSILQLACNFQYDDCLRQSRILLNQWLTGSKGVIPANLISIVLEQGMKSSNAEIWNEIWERYLRESSARSRVNFLLGLAATPTPWLLNRLLNYAMNDSLIRSQDFSTVVSKVAQNPSGGFLAWNFYRNHWEELVKKFTLNDVYLGDLILPITSWFTAEVQLDELNHFIEKYPNGGAGTRAREEAKERVKENIRWLKIYREPVTEWLINNNGY